jgi:hypothetical protein
MTMLRWVVLAATLSALLSMPASAQYRRWEGGPARVQQGQQRAAPGGRPGQRPPESDRRERDDGRRGAMSPDERRELNRDLERANREIYRKGKDRR